MYMKNVVCDICDMSNHHFVLMLMHCTRYSRHWKAVVYIDGLGQERRNSSASAMELRVSCTNPSILFIYIYIFTDYITVIALMSMHYLCFTDWDRDKMAYFVQTTFSDALSSMKTSLLWLGFHLKTFSQMAKWTTSEKYYKTTVFGTDWIKLTGILKV